MPDFILRNLIISRNGTSIRKKGDFLHVVVPEGEEKTGTTISAKGLEQIIITAEASISSGAIELLLSHGVDVVFIKHRPHFFARVISEESGRITDLWRAQLQLDEMKRIQLAQEFIRSSAMNKAALLRSLENGGTHFRDEREGIGELMTHIEQTQSLDILLSIEGRIAKIYFDAIRQILPEGFRFTSREKNPPPDPFNSMLGYGYTVLASRIEYSLFRAGLNPYEGILHVSGRGRKSLTFDLIEEFRQPVIDRVIISLSRKGSVTLADFYEPTKGICHITGEGKRTFLDALYHRLETKVSYHSSSTDFMEIMFSQARLLAQAIRGSLVYKGYRYRV